MRKLPIVLLLLVIILYLYWNYTRFYNVIGQRHLPSPNTQSVYELGNPKDPPLVYVALGDSLTAGVGALSYQNTYPYLLAKQFSTNQHVYLYNFGQPGGQVGDLLDYQLVKTISLKPSLITILIGINDLQNYMPISRFQTNYQTLITQLKSDTTAQIVLINLPYLGSEKSVFPPWNWLLDFQTHRYNQVINQLCQENNLTCLDLYQHSRQAFKNDPTLYANDYFHPSDAGYILWSALINEHFSTRSSATNPNL